MRITRRVFGKMSLATIAGAASIRLAHADASVDRIRRAGKLVVATEAQFVPYEFVQDGRIVGLGRAVLDEIGKALGDIQIEQFDLPFQGILPGLLAGKFDLVATSLGINAERARRYAFTRPLGESTPHVFVRKGRVEVRSLSDLNGKVVTTQLASAFESTARAIDEQLKAAGGAGFRELQLYPNFNEVFLAVGSRRADAGIAALPTLNRLLRDRPDTFEITVGARAQRSYLAWATRAEDKDLRDFINTVIADMTSSGKMGELQERWLGMRLELPESGYLPEGAI